MTITSIKPTRLRATLAIDLGDRPHVEHHCTHADGTQSWTFAATEGECYLWGTLLQLDAFATAVRNAVLDGQRVKETV